MRGALGASDKLIETAVDAAKSDDSVRAIRNAIILGKILGSINPDVLQGVAVAVEETLGGYQKSVIEPPGLFSLLTQYRHKEVLRSIALVMAVSAVLPALVRPPKGEQSETLRASRSLEMGKVERRVGQP